MPQEDNRGWCWNVNGEGFLDADSREEAITEALFTLVRDGWLEKDTGFLKVDLGRQGEPATHAKFAGDLSSIIGARLLDDPPEGAEHPHTPEQAARLDEMIQATVAQWEKQEGIDLGWYDVVERETVIAKVWCEDGRLEHWEETYSGTVSVDAAHTTVCGLDAQIAGGGAVLFDCPLPISALAELSVEYPGHVFDTGLAHAYGVRFFFAFEVVANEHREQVARKLEQRWSDPIERWPRGTSTGKSSMTLYKTLREARRPREVHIPHDAADLFRCLEMLDVCGFWSRRTILPGYLPEWQGLLTNRMRALWRAGAKEAVAELFKEWRDRDKEGVAASSS